MEKVKFLQECVVSAMQEYADYLAGGRSTSIVYSVLVDETQYKYQLLAQGWEDNERIFSVIFHAEIIGEHIWIQEDNTEEGLANLLMRKNVSKQDIVLAYYPEYHRKYTEFAVH